MSFCEQEFDDDESFASESSVISQMVQCEDWEGIVLAASRFENEHFHEDEEEEKDHYTTEPKTYISDITAERNNGQNTEGGLGPFGPPLPRPKCHIENLDRTISTGSIKKTSMNRRKKQQEIAQYQGGSRGGNKKPSSHKNGSPLKKYHYKSPASSHRSSCASDSTPSPSSPCSDLNSKEICIDLFDIAARSRPFDCKASSKNEEQIFSYPKILPHESETKIEYSLEKLFQQPAPVKRKETEPPVPIKGNKAAQMVKKFIGFGKRRHFPDNSRSV
jgi:hypothetical protein